MKQTIELFKTAVDIKVEEVKKEEVGDVV